MNTRTEDKACLEIAGLVGYAISDISDDNLHTALFNLLKACTALCTVIKDRRVEEGLRVD